MTGRRPDRSRAAWAARMVGLRDDERGVGMIMAVGVSAIVFLLTVTWTGIANHQVSASGNERSSEQATHAAEAGVHRAMSLLSADPDQAHPFTATEVLDRHGDTYGEFEVTVEAPNGITDPRRRITSTGWAPSRTSALKSSKRAQVELSLSAGTAFSHVLFAGDGDLVLGNTLNITGDMYASGKAHWESSGATTIVGNVTSWGSIQGGVATLTGDLHTIGKGACTGEPTPCGVKLDRGVFNGDVLAAEDASGNGGQVRLNACGGCTAPVINGDVTAPYGTTGTGDVTGQVKKAQPDEPTKWSMPGFSWVAGNYTPTGVDRTVSTFTNGFQAAYLTGFSGHYRVQDTTGTVELGGSNCVSNPIPLGPPICTPIVTWAMNGDVTIYADRPVKLSADITNSSLPAKNLRLVIVTTFDSGSPTDAIDAVEFVGDVSPPSSIEVLVVALNDRVYDTDATAQSLPKGAIYGAAVTLGDNWTIAKGDFSSVPGFTWTIPEHAPIEIVSYHDLPPP